ncbi:MAG TPA: 4-alpha-glucanotransferase [Treponemataceae bacterium]|nr:4-alpha-glucanotransferase [Treponemataceae bacterium]
MEKMTGTAIPLSALKTKNSLGCGEYPDLIKFADFCLKSNLQIIQLLPINDTGTSSSPYNALSAFALHPIYISIKNLPETQKNQTIKKNIATLEEKHNNKKRFDYTLLRKDKIALLHKIYTAEIETLNKDTVLDSFIRRNENWLPFYCVYMGLKKINNEASWKEWTRYGTLDKKEILKRWNSAKLLTKHRFYAWIQLRAHEQFLKSSQYVKKQGLLLKGDIPILMNEDSADAWSFPEYFNTKLRAGAPADELNPEGQNWGFPTYNWENLAKDKYVWWIDRLKQSAKYYEIYRIDHVLGFFRIWSIPEGDCTALNGWPMPYKGISREELHHMGYDDDRIRWMSKPHVPTKIIEEVNNNDYLAAHGELRKIMVRIGDEELWVFSDTIVCDQDILDREDIPLPIRQKLVDCWRNRMLVEPEPHVFYPQWTFKKSTSWQSLNHNEQQSFETLISKNTVEQEAMWASQARTLLGMLKKNTKMIACAEDLGSMPDCVPAVLEELDIFGLRVIRWNRKWKEHNQPFYSFNEYPKLSVATTSVHDSSTLRLWWLNESDALDFYKQFPPAQIPGIHYNEGEIQVRKFSSKTAHYLLNAIAQATSTFCIHPIQDFLALGENLLDSDAGAERINIPGTVSDFNWTYRLPVPIEDLKSNDLLCSNIASIVTSHNNI